ncbi:MAG: glycine zipper 2TM domain-containing protein [Burkholderiaceae bacterium]
MKTSTKQTLGLAPVVIACLGALMSACGPSDGGSASQAAAQATAGTSQAIAAAAATQAIQAPAPATAQPPLVAAKPAPVHSTAKAPAMQKVATQQSAPAPVAPRPDTVGAVKAIEPITETRSSGAGAVVGGLLGGVVGHQFGKGDGKKAMTVVGAVGGAVAGNEVEKSRNRKVLGYRVKVQLDNGESRTYEPTQIGDLKVGDRVRIDQGQLHKA